MAYWKYYNLSHEPRLDHHPLISIEDSVLFHGRVREKKILSNHIENRIGQNILIIGDTGIGKTTFVSMSMLDKKGFIKIDLSDCNDFDSSRTRIALELLKNLENVKKSYTDLKRRLNKSISISNTRNLGIKPSGIGISSERQETEIELRENILDDIIFEAYSRLSKVFGNLTIFIDETDFLEPEQNKNLCKLVLNQRRLLGENSNLIIANRDESGILYRGICNEKSDLNKAFNMHIQLKPLWPVGSGQVREIIDRRLRYGNPDINYKFPLSDKAIKWLDMLSSGNYRSLLKYTEKLLLLAAIDQESIPLDEKYSLVNLIENFPELRIHNDEDIDILNLIKTKPRSASDEELQDITGYTRSYLRKKLIKMEKAFFIQREKRGRKIEFSITPKAKYMLELDEEI